MPNPKLSIPVGLPGPFPKRPRWYHLLVPEPGDVVLSPITSTVKRSGPARRYTRVIKPWFLDKLLEYVEYDTNGGCWLWSGKTVKGEGYGNFLGLLAHRVVYACTRGVLPDDRQVHHSCDVPTCVNPAHLWLGTHQENMLDASRKGRHWLQKNPKTFSGEKSATAKLTWAEVREIRARAGTAFHREIAADYGVCRELVSQIIRGTVWAE